VGIKIDFHKNVEDRGVATEVAALRELFESLLSDGERFGKTDQNQGVKRLLEADHA
jgi:hypothetical protein